MPTDQQDNVAQFARARNADSDTVGIKIDCPKETVLWLDAESLARGEQFRGPLILEILGEWAREQKHRHMVRQRVTASNSPLPDMAGASVADEVVRAAEARSEDLARA